MEDERLIVSLSKGIPKFNLGRGSVLPISRASGRLFGCLGAAWLPPVVVLIG